MGVLAVLVAVLSACGGKTSNGASSTGHGGSPPAQQALMVIATPGSGSTMVVRVVDNGGHVHARAEFTPPAQPTLGNCADLLQPPVRVAAGAVFFADGTGAVHRLGLDSKVSDVTTFPLTGKQQLLSYAVSPDGSRLMAIVISTPPLHVPPPQTLGDPMFGPGTWSLDLETASVGGPATTVLHRDLGSVFPAPTVITGWDAFGPTATLNSVLCTQGALASWRYNGTLIHLAQDGTHLDAVGGAGCQAADELTDGTVVCGATDWRSFSVRHADGTVVWSAGAGELSNVRLAPDGDGVSSAEGTVYLRGAAHPASFARSAGFQGEILGWADARTLVVFDNGRIGLAPATDPLVFKPLGLSVSGQSAQSVPYGVALVGTLAGA